MEPTAPPPAVAGLLLTGGRSRRLGSDKAALLIDGTSCARRVGEALAAVVSPVLEVGPGRSGLEAVGDDRPGQGPLAAVARGWAALSCLGHTGPVVVLACDLPLVSQALLRRVANWPGDGGAVPVVQGRRQTLCARYAASAVSLASAMVGDGRRAMKALVGAGPVELLEEQDWCDVAVPDTFSDIDVPGDLALLGTLGMRVETVEGAAVEGGGGRGGGALTGAGGTGLSRGTDAAVRRRVSATRVTALRGRRHLELPEALVAEEPLEIRVSSPGLASERVVVTMRTPGNDFELAVGFLVSEELIEPGEEVLSVRYCDLPAGEPQRFNVVSVQLARPRDLEGHRRAFAVSAACGVCGTEQIDRLIRDRPRLAPGLAVRGSVLVSLPETLRASQRVFDQTGGLHAAGLFDPEGRLLQLREDVGRHNAVDKLVGRAALDASLPLSDCVMAVSGRVSFEIVQKAAVAGIPVLAAVSAPSSLAVETAERLGMTLAAFVRGDRANLYTHPDRVELEA